MSTRAVTIASLLAAFATPALAQSVIGGFGPVRGGLISLESGEWFDILRCHLRGSFSGLAFTSSETLTPEFLDGLDILLISTIKSGQQGIDPLSPREQAAMVQFVLRGGAVIILADNISVGGYREGSSNASCLTPFGFSLSGTGPLDDRASAVSYDEVTDGPFGKIGWYYTYIAGWLTGIPPGGTVLARLQSNNQPALAVLERDALAPGSGPVVVFTDTSMFFDQFIDGDGIILGRNAVALGLGDTPWCYYDCDHSGGLDIDDFICFQTLFGLGDAGADCDGSCDLDVDDFVCFQTNYAFGCP